MSGREDFAFLIEEMLNFAIRDFKETEQYKLLKEKLDRMNLDCDTMLTEDEKAFAFECFELILETDGEESFVYRKGLQDGVKILKWLGALS